VPELAAEWEGYTSGFSERLPISLFVMSISLEAGLVRAAARSSRVWHWAAQVDANTAEHGVCAAHSEAGGGG
jgi:hypothetical protein